MLDGDFVTGHVTSCNAFFRDVPFPLAMCQIALPFRFKERDN
jgi:hypothetical protein